MKIPNCSNAVVEARKVADYLLSLEHPEGESKARFFLGWGFSRRRWQILASALTKHAEENDCSAAIPGKHGTKYVVVGSISAPKGITPPIKTIWIVDDEEQCPRLITAYPES
ncbi:MAG: hypothetical protein N838_17715 [Thiohalocapsa sp. PB-PSB1]|jgi:hypothetical protein|nr:MAG: hypothetical protein N838_17715 [Thiohalocapsa sp. PB-PSB1]HCS88980.1 hypothetical protein [Chromatiaceae bacterium]